MLLLFSFIYNYCSSVGEPLNDEAWLWYHNVVGDGRCTVVDTWWQTGITLLLLFSLSQFYNMHMYA